MEVKVVAHLRCAIGALDLDHKGLEPDSVASPWLGPLRRPISGKARMSGTKWTAREAFVSRSSSFGGETGADRERRFGRAAP
jgi:hypothetical protein